MPVEVDSRIGAIVTHAEASAEHDVASASREVAVDARLNLLLQGSVKTGELFDTIASDSEGFIGEITAGRGLPDSRAVYIELGTGERGSRYEFPGKPDGVAYDMAWTRGIPKDPTHGFAFLIPALEAQREPFYEDAAGWYR